MRTGLRLPEVAFPGTRKHGGLPPAHTARVCRDMAGNLQRETELWNGEMQT